MDNNSPPWKNHRQERLAARDQVNATRFWPLFPPVVCAALSSDEPGSYYGGLMLEYWRQLMPVYVATLSETDAEGFAPRSVEVESWPVNDAQHQAALTALLAESKLRAAWREQQQSFRTAITLEESEVLERAHCAASHPLAEIPVYQGMFRFSCQQLVCLPLADWQALFDPTQPYSPATVDSGMVRKWATRIALAFNVPPQKKEYVDYRLDDEPIVWKTSLRCLTEPIDNHGMADRYKHQQAGQAERPEKRYDGYFGCLKVTLPGNEIWMIAVLAPGHFIHRLMVTSADWFAENEEKST